MNPALATLRRAAPWIASLLAHVLLVLLVPLSVDLGSRQTAVERRVVLQFEDEVPSRVEPSAPSGPAISTSDLPMPSRLSLPDAPSVETAPVMASAIGPRTAAAPTDAAPSAREILESLPAVTVASSTAARADSAASTPTVRVEWSGTPRKLVKEVKPPFPAILSQTGQEAEVVARITVSPLGAVRDVEITRSSGYIEIDAAVESALRNCVYSRIEGKQNQIGTVYYRFPLEKRD